MTRRAALAVLATIVPATQVRGSSTMTQIAGLNPLDKRQRFFLNLDDFQDITVWKDGTAIVVTADDIWAGLGG